MNASSTSLNLIPLFIFMIFIGILVIVFTRVIKPWVNGNLSWKKNSFFAGLYLALLFILVPIFYLLPTQEFAQPSEVKSQNIDHSRTDVVDSFSSTENLDQIQGVYKNSTQTFKVDTHVLSFNEAINRGNYQIFIKRSDVNDGEIEVSTYIYEQFSGKIDLTKRIPPPSISLQNGRLTIETGGQSSFEFKQFLADFTVDQFRHHNQEWFYTYRSPSDWRIIYLRVPQNLEIQNPNSYNIHVL